MSDLDTSKDNSNSWGGARPGAGRPKGSMNESTKERAAIKRAFQDRVAHNADRLFNAQFNLALGEQYLFVKRKIKNGDKVRYETEVVTDTETIKDYINGDLDDSDNEYYYMSTKPANGMAIDSMLDRAFGKSENKLDVTSDGEKLESAGAANATLVDAFIENLKNDTANKAKPN